MGIFDLGLKDTRNRHERRRDVAWDRGAEQRKRKGAIIQEHIKQRDQISQRVQNQHAKLLVRRAKKQALQYGVGATH